MTSSPPHAASISGTTNVFDVATLANVEFGVRAVLQRDANGNDGVDGTQYRRYGVVVRRRPRVVFRKSPPAAPDRRLARRRAQRRRPARRSAAHRHLHLDDGVATRCHPRRGAALRLAVAARPTGALGVDGADALLDHCAWHRARRRQRDVPRGARRAANSGTAPSSCLNSPHLVRLSSACRASCSASRCAGRVSRAAPALLSPPNQRPRRRRRQRRGRPVRATIDATSRLCF